MIRMMIMAGGTGGHVYPALAVADELTTRGVEVSWVGSPDSFEFRVVSGTRYSFDAINIKGLRRSGWVRKLMMPLMMMKAMAQVLAAILRRKPNVVLGMGGFVSGPGGLVAAALRLPLVLHEQNSIAGLTNKWLSRISHANLTGFPEAEGIKRFRWVGNPVRADISGVSAPDSRLAGRSGPLRILVVGGSQGAAVFNQNLPELLGSIKDIRFEIHHQTGRGNVEPVEQAYSESGCDAVVTEFIEDMAAAYSWCDVVVCRSGAMTVSEICNAGVTAVFVPYPYAVNDHQAKNASYLVECGAAIMVRQEEFVGGAWVDFLIQAASDRERLASMAKAARTLARPDATSTVADVCMEAIHA